MLLGAGRARMDSKIDPAVGAVLHKKLGEGIEIGEPLCTLFVNDESRLDEAVSFVRGAIRIGAKPVTAPALIVDRIASAPVGSRTAQAKRS
jgi:thymidine phosphorylase